MILQDSCACTDFNVHPFSRLLLRRHELPVDLSAFPYTKRADTIWSYVATDLFGGTFDSIRHSSNYADPSASDPAGSTSSTTSTASIRFPFDPNDFVTSTTSHPQHPPRSDSLHSSPITTVLPIRPKFHLESPNLDCCTTILLATSPTSSCANRNSHRPFSAHIHTHSPQPTPCHHSSTHLNYTNSPYRATPGTSIELSETVDPYYYWYQQVLQQQQQQAAHQQGATAASATYTPSATTYGPITQALRTITPPKSSPHLPRPLHTALALPLRPLRTWSRHHAMPKAHHPHHRIPSPSQSHPFQKPGNRRMTTGTQTTQEDRNFTSAPNHLHGPAIATWPDFPHSRSFPGYSHTMAHQIIQPARCQSGSLPAWCPLDPLLNQSS